MSIGPFTTYAPPGPYVRTVAEPVVGLLLGGLRIPVLIGTGQETLTQTDYEIVRGSSSNADTPIFNEDASGRWVVGGTDSNPILGNQDGNRSKIRVRNFPIVNGDGEGKTSFDTSKVSVTVDGTPVVVSAIDGLNGYITLLVPPGDSSLVVVSYFFHRKDTRIIDVVSGQVTPTAAILVAPKVEPYSIILNSNDTLNVTVNDGAPSVIKLTPGTARTATDIANDILAAGITGLTASLHVDAQGLNHVRLIAQGNVLVGSGNANGALGLNPGDYTNRNKTFRVFNGPIVDGSDGGITTTDPSKVVVLVNGTQVLAKAVNGSLQTVELAAAPLPNSVVSIQYYFNTFQDTFDYLPNSGVRSVGNVGISPGRTDFLNGPDFIIQNQGDQSLIQWGTAVQIAPGVKTGLVSFDSTQVVASLVDNKVYGTPCQRFVDPSTSVVSTNKFVLPLSPRTGNGRDTPLGSSLYQTVTNGRIDLPTNRPDLVTVYVGKTWRDAVARPPVSVLSVDSTSNTVTLAKAVPADYTAFASFYYNRISDDKVTLSVVASGPSGVGQYTINSDTNGSLMGVRFTTKSGLAETVQWPSGSETLPDAILSGSGSPVPETVTVTFSNALAPATNASVSNGGQEPYDIYTASRIFGGVVVDGNAPVSTDLSSGFRAQLLGQPIAATGLSFLTSDRLVLNVDGVRIAPISLSGLTTIATIVSAINSAIDGDVQAHLDGSATFSSSAPNALASAITVGSQSIIVIKGRNLQTQTNGLVSSVTVLSPTGVGETDGAPGCGLSPNLTSSGSFSAINQPARLVGSQVAPFNISAGATDNLQLTVDGLDIGSTLPSGSAVTLDAVVSAINTSYLSVASSAEITTLTNDVVGMANAFRTAYTTHIASTVFHASADGVNGIVLGASSDLATAIALLNEEKAKFNLHLSQVGVHQLNDTTNVVTAANATDLQTAAVLAYALKVAYNTHLSQKGVHGHTDTTNTVVTINASDATTAQNLANALKVSLNAHFTQAGVHLTNDVVNTVAAANASDPATSNTLANACKVAFNAHLSQIGVHVVNDTTNAVSTPDASNPATLITLVNALKAAVNAHFTQTQGLFGVHGTNDATNLVSANLTELIAKTGLGINAGRLILESRINTVSSQVSIKTTSTAAVAVGMVPGASASRTQPTASKIAAALNANSSFLALAVAYAINAPGLGNFLKINSRTAGSLSTISFSSVSNSALIPDTGLGIVVGTTSDAGEAAQAGFTVTSSAGASGSHGTGFPGQTYTDATTGLRFTVLPASAGDYSNNGSFNLVVSPNFTVDASLPVRAIPGVELTVYNTVNMNAETTAIVSTFARNGSHPQVGDVYYISYQYEKSNTDTALFRDLKKIQQNFGAPTPDNPLSLGARLALLNGAVLIGLKQVLRSVNGSQASTGAFTDAIDEQKKALPGNIKADVITPLGTDPTIFAYLNAHCVFMSSPRQEGERIGVVGVAAGTSPLGVQAIARGISSELMLVTYPDSFVVSVQDDLGNSVDRLVDGTLCAAALAGSTCNPSVDVATPLTRRQIIGFKNVGRVLDPTEANQTAVKGVTIIESVDSGLRVRHGLTTRLDNVITRTPSVTMTIHLVQQTIRRVLDPFIGQKFTGALLKSVESALVGAFQGLISSQIVGKVSNISVTTDENDPTILRAEAIYVPVFPLEYVVATLGIRVRLLETRFRPTARS